MRYYIEIALLDPETDATVETRKMSNVYDDLIDATNDVRSVLVTGGDQSVCVSVRNVATGKLLYQEFGKIFR
jgi:hypothetical protein